MIGLNIVAGISKRFDKYQKWKKATESNRVEFRQSGLPRPQEVSQEFLQRARQLNFNLVKFGHEHLNIIKDWEPADTMLVSKEKWQCYYKPEEKGEPRPTWVLKDAQFTDMVDKLRTCEEFALDLEGHGDSTKLGKLRSSQLRRNKLAY
jgi:hypothetical protein